MRRVDLSKWAGVNPETISRITHRGGSWSQATARKVFEILGHRLPLTERDAIQFCKLTGIEPVLDGERFDATTRRRLISQGLLQAPQSPPSMTGGVIPTQSIPQPYPNEPNLNDLDGFVAELAERFGGQRVRGALDGLFVAWSMEGEGEGEGGGGGGRDSAIGNRGEPPAEPRQIAVVEPPLERDGMVQTVHHIYEVRVVEPTPKKARKIDKDTG